MPGLLPDLDPDGLLASFAAFYDLAPKDVAAVYVQRTEDAGRKVLGRKTQSVHLLAKSKARTVFVAAFDAGVERVHERPHARSADAQVVGQERRPHVELCIRAPQQEP